MMGKAAKWIWILSLSLRLSFIQLTTIHKNPGYISIDCGSPKAYLYEETGIWYENDTNFVQTGTNSRIDPRFFVGYHYFGGLLKTLRSFPVGNRNCYTLKPKQGKNNKYLIRAYFMYGNYDGKNESQAFDLYLGVNYWVTITFEPGDSYVFQDIIHTPTTNTIHVCLVRGPKGVPFISGLELRPLSNSIYQTPWPSSQSLLILQGRVDVAASTFSYSNRQSRYKDDIYDRLWYNEFNDIQDWHPFNRSVDITSDESTYELPQQVMRSASKSANVSSSLEFDFNSIWGGIEDSAVYYVYFHFAETEKLPDGHKRIMNISLYNNQSVLSVPVTLEYLKAVTISPQYSTQSFVQFRISAASGSAAPPFLNAFEVYQLISPLPPQTDIRDAILEIKSRYNISNLDWQGDPCLPKDYAWDKVSCNSDMNDNARITSLNLSASKLTGQIITSFSQLTELVTFNLTGNNFTGSIPKALEEKSNVTLQLSLDDNPGLCQTSSCESKAHKSNVPLIASIVALVVFVVIIVCVSVKLWRLRSKKQRVMLAASNKDKQGIAKNQTFSNSEILGITNNLKTVIGRGGFGNVYLGTLQDGAQVAVKILSETSRQGFKEFQSEAKLLKFVHHKNLVSLIGYCDEVDMKALVYEYMAKGSLQHQLSDKNPTVLKWNERLQIALDAAYGFDYLHNGCKPPIVHRDLKPSNILLNGNMQAKISDFGLSRAFANDSDTHLLTTPAGTYGYLDPQLHISKKSDIYSFGIILLELITGKPAVTEACGKVNHILQWVVPLIEKGDIPNIMDPRFEGNFNTTSAQKAIEVAMSCISKDVVLRPDISHTVAELKECLNLEIMIHGSSSSVFESDITEILPR
ncbi:putative LRR receptor-like serine/threonine-protein kinase [Senna tora]|uniref:Putative LRR receptor-like serine/threonine-protein kinase n=1 Tax=Senna tora TaxID=362788 RepID=A0A834WCL3_9FABA|nr:putative LRR receptor-like serine/threonine-protein kinase [Senna tora]